MPIIALLAIGLLLFSPIVSNTTVNVKEAEAQSLSRAERNWENHNHNSLGSNYNPQTQINPGNVGNLGMKWMYPIPSLANLGLTPGDGRLAGVSRIAEGTSAYPLIVDGVIYVAHNARDIIALDAETGAQIWYWENEYDNDAAVAELPIRGVSAHHTHAIHYADGKIWVSNYACKVTALDAKTGEISFEIDKLCGEIPLNSPDGKGIPGNSGWYNSYAQHPPSLYLNGNSFIWCIGGHSEGVHGGRFFCGGYDLTTGAKKWRTFLQPPCGQTSDRTSEKAFDQDIAEGKFLNCNPAFREEGKAWGEYLIDNCAIIWIQSVNGCDINQDILRNDWDTWENGMPHNAGISNVWGTIVVDEETGIAYLGTAQPGPDWNATYVPGPRLFGSAIVALDMNTGDLVWAHQSTTRDLWDYDCSWNTILTTTTVKGSEEKVVIKGCKNGHIWVLDAATGETYHDLLPSTLEISPDAAPLDPLKDSDLLKPWMNYPSTDPTWMNCPVWGCLESDIAFDHDNNIIIAATQNNPVWAQVQPTDGYVAIGLFRSGQSIPPPFDPEYSFDVTAFDVDTGKELWHFTVDGTGYRGGTMASGGLVFPTPIDGHFRALDIKTGEVVFDKVMEPAVNQATIGATSDGKMIVLRTTGGSRTSGVLLQGVGNTAPGGVIAYGLPDQAMVEVREVEKVVEVEVEKVVEVERIVEVETEVEVETISPISYVAIGLGVILVVVSGILFSRSRAST